MTTTKYQWNWDDNYSIAYAETSDPSVLLVIKRDLYPTAPDGDCYAPAYWWKWIGSGWRYDKAGDTFTDDTVIEAYVEARSRFGYDTASRFMQIFYDTALIRVNDSGDLPLLIFNTPAFRDYVGIDDTTIAALEGDRHDWQAYLDGDVFGIGYAVSETRTTTETPVDLDDVLQNWEINIECSGFYGEEWAKSEAESYDPIDLNLTPLLDFTNPEEVTL